MKDGEFRSAKEGSLCRVLGGFLNWSTRLTPERDPHTRCMVLSPSQVGARFDGTAEREQYLCIRSLARPEVRPQSRGSPPPWAQGLWKMPALNIHSFFTTEKTEQFFCCKDLSKPVTGPNGFDTMDSYENSHSPGRTVGPSCPVSCRTAAEGA